MSEFEELLEKIREQKPELTKEAIDDRIKEKKEKIGTGYLTDQGALFLIASDLGISLKQSLKVELFHEQDIFFHGPSAEHMTG